MKTTTWTSTEHDRALLATLTPKGLIGIDEVGRGCVAGPIVACAVLIRPETVGFLENKVADSKKLSEKARESLAQELRGNLEFYIAYRGADWIDQNGIQAANMGIFAELIESVAPHIGIALIDGTQAPKKPAVPVKTVVKGESVSVAIAAASVLAKVHRDALMRQLAEQHPAYGFEDHKGYGTAKHTEALRTHGLLAGVHRRQFCASLLAP